jgi:geranylgeranyl reductase family protein
MRRNMYDALIIGAGPAGGAAAHRLTAAGLRPLVLEKEAVPRDKPCAGGVPVDVFSSLSVDLSPVVENWVEEILFRYRDEAETEARLPPGTMAMVRRSRFDALLAESSGAELRDRFDCRAIRERDSYVEVESSGGEIAAGRFLIVASGSSAPFDRLFRDRSCKSKRIRAAVTASVYPDRQRLAAYHRRAVFEFGSVPGGYIWLFPKSDHLSVGAGLFTRRSVKLPPAVRRTLDDLGLEDCDMEELRGHPILLPNRTAILRRGRVLRAGEAAGLLDPLVGEGIRYAAQSGILAGEAVAAADPARYERRCRREILGDLLWARLPSRLFYGFPGIAFRFGVRNPLFLDEFVRLFRGSGSYRRMTLRLLPYLAAGLFTRRPAAS